MLRNLLILLLTLFQDKYVRTGTLVGILIGIWNPEILQGEQGKKRHNTWFCRMGHRCFSWLLQERELRIYKKKEIQSLPRRQVIPSENFQPFPSDPPVTISGFFTISPFFKSISLRLRIFADTIIFERKI